MNVLYRAFYFKLDGLQQMSFLRNITFYLPVLIFICFITSLSLANNDDETYRSSSFPRRTKVYNGIQNTANGPEREDSRSLLKLYLATGLSKVLLNFERLKDWSAKLWNKPSRKYVFPIVIGVGLVAIAIYLKNKISKSRGNSLDSSELNDENILNLSLGTSVSANSSLNSISHSKNELEIQTVPEEKPIHVPNENLLPYCCSDIVHYADEAHSANLFSHTHVQVVPAEHLHSKTGKVAISLQSADSECLISYMFDQEFLTADQRSMLRNDRSYGKSELPEILGSLYATFSDKCGDKADAKSQLFMSILQNINKNLKHSEISIFSEQSGGKIIVEIKESEEQSNFLTFDFISESSF